MKQELSALMDGELDDEAARRVLAQTGRDDESYAVWRSYHLIGDCLRGECDHRSGLHRRISEHLAQEPTVLAPPRRAKPRWVQAGAALAASVAAVTMVAWMMQRSASDDEMRLAASGKARPALVAASPPETRRQMALSSRTLNGYLLAHEEFSASPGSYSMAGLQRAAAGDDR